MIDLKPYRAIIDGLRDGERVRAEHCPGSSSLPAIISREGQRVSMYCFRCGDHGSMKPHESLSQRLHRLKTEKQELRSAAKEKSLPQGTQDFTEFPQDCLYWFLKVGVTTEMAEYAGMYYSQRMNRVILPIYWQGETVGWSGRSMEGSPKSVTSFLREGKMGSMLRGDGSIVVLTEDQLSALKVHWATGLTSIALIGTHMQDTVLNYVADKGAALVWLDGDEAGRSAARKMHRKLRAYGVASHNHLLYDDRDPKDHSRQEIKNVVRYYSPESLQG